MGSYDYLPYCPEMLIPFLDETTQVETTQVEATQVINPESKTSEKLETFLEKQKEENRLKILRIINLLGEEPYGKKFKTVRQLRPDYLLLLEDYFETEIIVGCMRYGCSYGLYTFGKCKKELDEEEKVKVKDKLKALHLEEKAIRKEIENYKACLKNK